MAERTVSRLLPARRSPPSWRTLLIHHAADLVAIDFFTVPTARLRVLLVFVVLAHHRRRVVHFNVPWAGRQARWPEEADCPTLDSVHTAIYRS